MRRLLVNRMENMITCVVPACNEAGHLEVLISDITSIAEITQIVICEGGSSDDTWKIAKKIQGIYPTKVNVLRQTGKGKFNAVLEGSELANEDYIMIWDADATVSLKSNQKLINQINKSNLFVMGNRLKGSKERNALKFLNAIGNYFFAILWSPILRFKVMDLLCGSKIFPKALLSNLSNDIKKVATYGDLTLIFAARESSLEIISIPVQYLARSYGTSNMLRWKTGKQFLLITMKSYKKFILNSFE